MSCLRFPLFIKFHQFHLVEPRPWPLLVGLGAFRATTGAVKMFKFHQRYAFILGLVYLLVIMAIWWRDVSREGAFLGDHTLKVQTGLKWGIILFIFSEVLFFASFFWTFFHRRFVPVAEIGLTWPPYAITPLNPMQVPLLNTAILLRSGVSVTWAHHLLVANRRYHLHAIAVTVGLGFYFTVLQYWEYCNASFTMADSIFGSVFFMATGFHGLHVIIGSLFLLACSIRFYLSQISRLHHLGVEFAIWYWHFVDVVWLFLFSIVYWWGYCFLSI